jgi:hypothetical protein
LLPRFEKTCPKARDRTGVEKSPNPVTVNLRGFGVLAAAGFHGLTPARRRRGWGSRLQKVSKNRNGAPSKAFAFSIRTKFVLASPLGGRVARFF